MKKVFTLCVAAMMLFSVSTASAKGGPKSSIDLEYQMYGDGSNGLGATFVYGLLAVGADYFSEDVTSGVYNIDNDYWTIHAGLNKRIFLMDALFVDARIGVFYQNLKGDLSNLDLDVDWEVSYDSNGDVGVDYKIKSDDFGFYLYPRVGFKVFKNLAVAAGYKMNFVNCKFDSEEMNTAFTLGASLMF
ncbi:MAG: hypothetical protein R3Y16_00110 [Rikenellaceae bacterium]